MERIRLRRLWKIFIKLLTSLMGFVSDKNEGEEFEKVFAEKFKKEF